LVGSRVIVESNNFLEDFDFFRDIAVLFLVFGRFIGKFLNSSSKLTFESDFFGIALINIGLSSSNVSNESIDLLLDFNEFFLVDLNLLFELQLEVSSGNIGVDLIFLGLGNLSLDGAFKIVKELKKFSLNLNPSFSLAVLESFEFEVSLVVVNVSRANFVG
jgi:hypothetical protein